MSQACKVKWLMCLGILYHWDTQTQTDIDTDTHTAHITPYPHKHTCSSLKRYNVPRCLFDGCILINFVWQRKVDLTHCVQVTLYGGMGGVNIAMKEPSFANFSNREKCIYLMSCNDRQILTSFGKIPPQLIPNSQFKNNTAQLTHTL